MAGSSQGTTKKSIYGVHPGVKMVQDWVAGLKQKSGRTLEEWIALVKKSGPADENSRRDWLKKEHNFGTNAAWWIAERASGKGAEEDTPEKYLKTAERYVEEMYAGGKSGLRPIYDALLRLGLSLGKDAMACPCKTMVPLYRKHVFANIKPTTRTRIDLGLCLRGAKPPKRVIDTGGGAKGDRITHRIEITAVKDIDAEVKRWLKIAYERDA